MRSDEEIALSLATALQELKAATLFCGLCHNIADKDPCAICDNEQRDRSIICVVEEPLDVQAIERTGSYQGLYHVLHGAISPVEGIGPDDLKLRELLNRLQPGHPGEEANNGETRELLVATNQTLKGKPPQCIFPG